ncbi:MAG: InlB B-repeat-containing protein [Bacilli bacterium]|nr:InlB B-repeat-containing protein [Bacilli bacterium]
MDNIIDNKKRRFFLIIGILFLIIVLIGSAYAFFSYSRNSQAFTLTSNGITARFTNGSNHINMPNAFPVSDEYAISNLSDLSYTDFTVTGNAENEDEAITYEIYLTEKDGNTLSSNYVKIYLTDSNGNVIVEPTIYSSLENTTYQNDAATGKLVLKNTLDGNFTKSYRLYAWIDSSFSQNESLTFDFYVNVYAYNALESEVVGESNITFNKQSGSGGTNSVEASYNDAMPTITLPTKSGYTFAGYFTGENGTGDQYYNADGSGVTGWDKTTDTTLYANWTTDEYLIVYYLDGGTVSSANPTTYSINSSAITLNNPTKVGYIFTGWSGTDLTGSENTTVTIPAGSTGNRYYTANFVPIGMTASDLKDTYVANSSSGLVAINNDGGLYTGTGTIREYRYSGVDNRWGGDVNNYIWFNNEMWRIVGIFKGDTDDGADAWNIKIMRDYSIGSYNGIEDAIQVPSSYASTGAGTKSLASGEIYSVTASGSRPAFTVQRVRWNSGGTNSTKVYPSTSGILLWLNEASNSNSWYYKNYDSSTGINKEYEEFIATTTFYTRAGNKESTVADEYNLERITGTIYNSEPTYTGKIGMLYPSDYAYASSSTIWNGTSTTMNNYDSIGGLSSNKLNNWILKPHGSSEYYWFISPSSASDTTVLCWEGTGIVASCDARNGINAVLNLKSSTSIVAGTGEFYNPYMLEENKYVIVYDLNGGSVASANPTYYTSESGSITLNNPTKEGYTFVGWTGSNGNVPQTTVTIPSGSIEGKHYIANWTANTYTISYTLNGGSVASANPTSYTIETSTFSLNNPMKTGYNFTGWSGTDINGTSNSVSIAKGSTGNRTYMANFTVDAIGNVSFTSSANPIYKGGSTATTTLTYSGTANTIAYSSNNSSVAIVSKVNNSTATITAVNPGSATITVTITDYDGNETTETININVMVDAENVSYTPPAGITCNGNTCDTVQLMIEKLDEMYD